MLPSRVPCQPGQRLSFGPHRRQRERPRLVRQRQLPHAANKNTYTGFSPPFQYNSFFSFDLSAVKGTIVSAQLVLEEESFFGVDPSETASVWDVSTSTAVLAKGGTTPGVFQDLQSG